MEKKKAFEFDKSACYVACLACMGAPDDFKKQCPHCNGSGESSGQRNKEAAQHEANPENIDMEGLIDAVRCMGFNPYRLSLLFSKHYCDEVWASFDAIAINESSLAENCASGTTDEGEYINPKAEMMKSAKAYFGWARLNFEGFLGYEDSEFAQRFRLWRE